MEKEIWKDIKDYEGYYQVSNLGNVRAMDRYIEHPTQGVMHKKMKLKAQWPNPDGYMQVKLSKNGENTNISVHILVAKAFLGEKRYEDGFEVNHKDLNRANNCVSNLEWTTHQENVDYSVKFGNYKHYGEDNPNYGKHTLHQKFLDNPELRKNQSRPGKQNGRCVSIVLINKDTDEKLLFDYLREAARYLIDNGLAVKKAKNLDSVANRLTKCLKQDVDYGNFKVKYA